MREIKTSELVSKGQKAADYDPNEIYQGFHAVDWKGANEDTFTAFDNALSEHGLELEIVADSPGDEHLFRVVRK